MAPIVSTIEVTRPPGEVFAYVTDPTRLREWQDGVVSARMQEGGQPAAGSRFTTITRIGGAEQTSTLEIMELSPPRVWSVRGIDGPVRVKVTVTVDPLPGGQGSRVTVALDFDGYGPGRMLVPLVVRPQAARHAPRSCQRLKEQLESQPR